jgi:cbb3-type cytochrome c oxidase subunit III
VSSVATVLAVLSVAASAGAAPKVDGKSLFSAKCAVCHGADGRAQSDYGKQHAIPDFTSKAWSAQHSEKELIATVTDGELEADMPAFGGQLSADQIKAVVGYVRQLPASSK